MFTEKDIQQIKARGNDLETVTKQVENFKRGFPFLELIDAASAGNGIIRLSEAETHKMAVLYDEKLAEGIKPLKFIPASGAASRMFKALYEALDSCRASGNSDEALAQNAAARQFLVNKEKFAFYSDLKSKLSKSESETNCSSWIDLLLNDSGLNYGALPKGLLKFHKYEKNSRTPFEEHLVEGALYAKDNNGNVKLHFTVSPEHQQGFERLLAEVKPVYEKEPGVKLDVTFSQQKPSTDTIAVDTQNEPGFQTRRTWRAD